jgi:hypothetical protein
VRGPSHGPAADRPSRTLVAFPRCRTRPRPGGSVESSGTTAASSGRTASCRSARSSSSARSACVHGQNPGAWPSSQQVPHTTGRGGAGAGSSGHDLRSRAAPPAARPAGPAGVVAVAASHQRTPARRPLPVAVAADTRRLRQCPRWTVPSGHPDAVSRRCRTPDPAAAVQTAAAGHGHRSCSAQAAGSLCRADADHAHPLGGGRDLRQQRPRAPRLAAHRTSCRVHGGYRTGHHVSALTARVW